MSVAVVALLEDSEAARTLSERVMEMSGAPATEVIISGRDQALTRFANGEIHQNVAERNSAVRVRVIEAGRTGVAGTNQLDDTSLQEAVARARDAARLQPPRGDLPGLVGPSDIAPLPIDPETAGATPEVRADMVGEVCRQADAQGVRAFGALSTGRFTYTVANSRGLFLHTPRTLTTLRVVTMSDGGTGYADRCSTRLADIDARGAGAEAIEKALSTVGAEPIEPGEYPVVLQEYAVAEILFYLAYIGFGGLAVEEARTFMRPGERITGPRVNIWDDGNDPGGLPMPFDFEGTPKQRVDLVREGVAVGLVYDLAEASRAGMAPTGHGLAAPNPFGSYASNLFMGGGDASRREDLLAGIKRGVWVTRLHYLGVVNPRRGSLTGMTRDGTFLIEDGRITRPIKDMRFTQVIPAAFEGITGMTRDTMLLGSDDYDWVSGARVPAVALERFNFTSVTR